MSREKLAVGIVDNLEVWVRITVSSHIPQLLMLAFIFQGFSTMVGSNSARVHHRRWCLTRNDKPACRILGVDPRGVRNCCPGISGIHSEFLGHC
jgi:hypothetical protein